MTTTFRKNARGAIPSPRHKLAAAMPYRPLLRFPLPYLNVPKKISFWGNNHHDDCVTAEEAFAKACNNPEIFISDDEVQTWATAHGVYEGAIIIEVLEAMQAEGFTRNEGEHGYYIYDDGPIYLELQLCPLRWR